MEVFYSLRLRGIILFQSIDVDGPDIKENREEQKKRKKSHDFAICKINSTVDFTTD